MLKCVPMASAQPTKDEAHLFNHQVRDFILGLIAGLITSVAMITQSGADQETSRGRHCH